MPKLALCLAFLFTFSAIAQPRSEKLDISKILNVKSDDAPSDQPLDIFYTHLVPQFEENPDPKRQVVMEYFQTEYDGSEASQKKLQWFKEMIDAEKNNNTGFGFEAQFIGPQDLDLERDDHFARVIEKLQPETVKYESIPKGIDFGGALDNLGKGRTPSSAGMLGKKYAGNIITLIKLKSSSIGTYIGLIGTAGVTAGVAASVSFIPGLASAGITYFQGAYQNWLTSGKWTTWLFESNSKIARALRKDLRLSPSNFLKNYEKKRSKLAKKFPKLSEVMPDTLQQQAMEQSKEAFSASKKRLKVSFERLLLGESYLKWFLSEFIFIAVSIKIPQAAMGIGSAALGTGALEVLAGTGKGMAAQMFGDIAVSKRKYQQLEELRQKIITGKHPNPIKVIKVIDEKKSTLTEKGFTNIVYKKEKKSLLQELDMVLDREGKYQNYNISSKYSHAALIRIENIARVKSSLFSIMSVVGVSLDIATSGGLISQIVIYGTGASGALYYAKVEGWLQKAVPKSFRAYVAKLQSGIKGLRLRPLLERHCQQQFLLDTLD